MIIQGRLFELLSFEDLKLMAQSNFTEQDDSFIVWRVGMAIIRCFRANVGEVNSLPEHVSCYRGIGRGYSKSIFIQLITTIMSKGKLLDKIPTKLVTLEPCHSNFLLWSCLKGIYLAFSPNLSILNKF